jgi:hypothetical protein
MFFLRCAFWLSIVYSSMSWTTSALQSQAVGTPALATARAATAQLADTALAGATDLCSRHAAECLADAARLTSLFANTDQSHEEATPASAPENDGEDVPLPVPDPRRRAGDAKLAHAS